MSPDISTGFGGDSPETHLFCFLATFGFSSNFSWLFFSVAATVLLQQLRNAIQHEHAASSYQSIPIRLPAYRACSCWGVRSVALGMSEVVLLIGWRHPEFRLFRFVLID